MQTARALVNTRAYTCAPVRAIRGFILKDPDSAMVHMKTDTWEEEGATFVNGEMRRYQRRSHSELGREADSSILS